MLEGERESGRRRGGEAGRRERRCSEDSSEAGGHTRGTAEDEGEGRHSSEVRDLREAQRKKRGQRAARMAERREECSGAARAVREYNTRTSILRTRTQERSMGQQRPIIRGDKKKK